MSSAKAQALKLVEVAHDAYSNVYSRPERAVAPRKRRLDQLLEIIK